MRRWQVVVGGALAATITHAAPKGGKKKPDPWLDVPRMSSTGSPTDTSVVTLDCAAVQGATPRRVVCKAVQAMILGPPSTVKLAEKGAEFDQLAKAKSHLAKVLAGVCAKKALAELSGNATLPDEQTYVGKVKDACAKKDGGRLVEAMRWRLANVEAHECSMIATTSEEEYVQQNADTWTSSKTGGLCGATTTATIWRNPGDFLWNYKQVRSVPPNADPKFCGHLSQVPVEWRWDSARTRDLGCRFFRL